MEATINTMQPTFNTITTMQELQKKILRKINRERILQKNLPGKSPKLCSLSVSYAVPMLCNSKSALSIRIYSKRFVNTCCFTFLSTSSKYFKRLKDIFFKLLFLLKNFPSFQKEKVLQTNQNLKSFINLNQIHDGRH